MSDALVYRRDEAGVSTLTLNRPDKLNSLNLAVFRELDRHVRDLANDPASIGCVIVRGAGRCFSAGHDLNDLSLEDGDEDFAFESATVERLANLPQAVISAVHGHCYTGALELALAGDIILASANARFADTHAKWALAPVWGMSQRLPRRVGFAKAREMMFTARTYSGAEAVSMGLANHCFADERFYAEVQEFAQSIVNNSRFSISTYKRLMAETDGLPLHAALSHEVHRYDGFGPDMSERVAAFANRKAER